MLAILEVAIFLSVDKKLIRARRYATKKAGLAGDAFHRHFDRTIWPAYLKHGRPPPLVAHTESASQATPQFIHLKASNLRTSEVFEHALGSLQALVLKDGTAVGAF